MIHSVAKTRLGRQYKYVPELAYIYELAIIFMGLDSVELIMEVEKHFSISIPNREAEKAYTVGKLVDCVANILAVKSYDFTLREKTFSLFKTELQNLRRDRADFSISSKVVSSPKNSTF